MSISSLIDIDYLFSSYRDLNGSFGGAKDTIASITGQITDLKALAEYPGNVSLDEVAYLDDLEIWCAACLASAPVKPT